MITCWRCKEKLTDSDLCDRNNCWYCGGHLCHNCAESFGECGHPFAEVPNDFSETIPKPDVQLLN